MTCGKWKLKRFGAVSLQGSKSGITEHMTTGIFEPFWTVTYWKAIAYLVFDARLSF